MRASRWEGDHDLGRYRVSNASGQPLPAARWSLSCSPGLGKLQDPGTPPLWTQQPGSHKPHVRSQPHSGGWPGLLPFLLPTPRPHQAQPSANGGTDILPARYSSPSSVSCVVCRGLPDSKNGVYYREACCSEMRRGSSRPTRGGPSLGPFRSPPTADTPEAAFTCGGGV